MPSFRSLCDRPVPPTLRIMRAQMGIIDAAAVSKQYISNGGN